MKVFFGCDNQDILKYKDEYLTIRDTIKKLGHTITRDWIDYSISAAKENKDDPSSKYYEDVIEAILDADVVILEGTVDSSSTGHELSLALQKGKPILYLIQGSEEALKKEFISGLQSPLLAVRGYKDIETLTKHINTFLHNFDGGIKVRFNLVMDKHQDNYLEWAAYNYKKSKTEIIKNALDTQREKDQKYQEYLDSQSSGE
jgi:nucleoside 2-deoxyribosyltransferase